MFIGGTYGWKWQTLRMWTGAFPRVHVGRVNSPTRLYECHYSGVESIDGTGWLRGGPESAQYQGLVRYLEDTSTGKQLRVLIQDDMFAPTDTGDQPCA